MIHSLRFRLIIAFIAVIAVTIGAISIFVGQRTLAEIRQFEERREQILATRLESELVRYYYRVGSWEGIQPFMNHIANLYGQHIILTDADGTVVADSEGEILGQQHPPDLAGITISLPWAEGTLGTLYVSALPSTDPISLWHLFGPIKQYVLWGCLIASGIALQSPLFCHGEFCLLSKPSPRQPRGWVRVTFLRGFTLRTKVRWEN